MINQTDLQCELANLKRSYILELESLENRVTDAQTNLSVRDQVSDHDAFNMSATCQNLAVLAGKIVQTANVLRWTEAS